ncbi:hypothetical protein MKW94_009172 [Papaver nudicaule]|uniref:SAM domain-containing protein n=1 Tax=Papaver nudicaule TaxID=74823 RepID=A0AA41RZR4_PAPNU|nr:hypothetical protein [Papaver nudicaule]
MEGGGSVTLPLQKKNNNFNIESLFTQLQTKWGELEKGFHGWVSKQSWVVQDAAFTAPYVLQGVAAGLIYGSLAQSELANCFFPFQAFGNTRLVQVRNFSVFRGTDGAMICAMKRIRGKDDTPARAVAGFTSWFMFQVVRNNPSPCGPDAIAIGLVFALCQGLLHEVQVRSISSQPPVLDDTCYTRTRCMLSNLGLQNYEKNFKKHLLTDDTIPLLNDRDLEKAEIPLGPRILIRNHIDRDPNLQNMRRN